MVKSPAMSARDTQLAKMHLSTATRRRPYLPWKNPVKRSRYRLVTAGVHKRNKALLRIKHFRHRSLKMRLVLRYHRVWHRYSTRR